MTEPKKYDWRLGEILIQNGWVTWEQLEKALKLQSETGREVGNILAERGVLSTRQARGLNLGEILVRHKWVTWEKLTEALRIQKSTNRMIGEILVENGYVLKKDLYHGLAIQFDMAFVDFNKITIPAEAPTWVEKRLAYEYRMMPLAKKGAILLMAIPDPLDIRPESELSQRLPDCEIRTALAMPEEIDAALRKHYGPAN